MSRDPLRTAASLAEEGRLDEAGALLRRCIADDPENPRIANALGVVALRQGQLEPAETWFRRAVAGDKTNPKFLANLGSVLVAAGRAADALEHFNGALMSDPRHADAIYNQALAFAALGRSDEAERCYRRVLDIDDAYVPALNNLGALLMNSGGGEAEACFRRVLELDGSNFDARCNLVHYLERRGMLAEAAAVAEELIAKHPHSPEAHIALAKVERRLGRHEAAIGRLRAHRHAARREVRADALFQLGKALDSAGQAAAAFDAFAEANAELYGGADSAIAERSAAILAEIKAVTAWLEGGGGPAPAANPPAAEGRRAVFFVGFPRSGTTLFEQILNAHPDIITSREHTPLAAAKKRLTDMLAARGDAYPEGLARLGAEDVELLRDHFWQVAQRVCPELTNRAWFVDKLPLNLAETVLMDRLFPDASVIVALRDPRDVCVSCFMQQFTVSPAMYGMRSLESTVALYAAVMDQWLAARRRIAIPWIEYKYENLIGDFAPVTRTVLEFAGIPWDDQLLDYRNRIAGNYIATPSYEGVAEPMTAGAVDRWLAYKDHLAPHLPVLEKYVEAFGYGPT